MRIKGESEKNFYPRLTGPKGKPMGIFASKRSVPASDLELVET